MHREEVQEDEQAIEFIPVELEAITVALLTVEAAKEQITPIREHSSNSNLVQLNKGGNAVNNLLQYGIFFAFTSRSTCMHGRTVKRVP